MGEFLAWMVGWALILEYAVAASAVSVGWSGYFVGLLDSSLGLKIPAVLTAGPYGGGIVNLPALVIALLVTWLLMIGTTESRSEEHTSELQSLMRTSYAVFCLKKKKKMKNSRNSINQTKCKIQERNTQNTIKKNT